MSLAELVPLVESLDQTDQRQLMTFLVSKFPAALQDRVFSAETYPIWSPYDSFEAADILMQMVNDDRDTSANNFGQTNFFREFDVCLMRSQRSIEITRRIISD